MLISVTQAVTIDAPPDAVLDFVGDAKNLPVWAPGAPRGLDVRVSRELGTVDFVAARGGAYSRVLPNGSGSEYVFTRFERAGAAPDEIAQGNAVIAQELEAVRRHCEEAQASQRISPSAPASPGVSPSDAATPADAR